MRPINLGVVGLLAVSIGVYEPVALAQSEELSLHVEVDPLPFILGGYGIQLGVAHTALPGWRLGLGNFSLDVPDMATQLNSDNEGFHLRVRHSHALYLLRFLSGLDGWCIGGSVRILRQRFTHDDAPADSLTIREYSVEAIAGYKWHPASNGFYLMPWVALAKPLVASDSVQLAGQDYNVDFVQLFGTVNVGWQF